MARYTYVSPYTGKDMEMDDWMMTENGIEAIQVGLDGHVNLILILPDGSIIVDKESGKSADSMQKAREEYQKMVEHQQESFKERAMQVIGEAAQMTQDKKKEQLVDPEDDEPEVPYSAPPGPDPYGYA